eukprot:TRINITY_DN1572_c0_g1_i1.p1 TRINITY_DN1572_c0_g1~~TRINITY_DN1572_c0_g1_i1.p1  ORF type:complete len:795 (+),score=186.01 TRINITY_DN1572_c0_g1_i1:36-2387(+)
MSFNDLVFGSLTPLFSEDGKNIIFGCENRLVILSVKTGQIKHIFEDHEDEITGITTNKNIVSNIVYTSCLDGKIRKFDINNQILLEEINVDSPIYALAVNEPQIYFSVSKSTLKSSSSNLYSQDSFTKQKSKKYSEPVSVLKGYNMLEDNTIQYVRFHNHVTQLKIFGDKILCLDGRSILVYLPATQNTERVRTSHVLTKLCVNKTSTIAMVGDAKGKLYFLEHSGSTLKRRTQHWHAHAVNALCFGGIEEQYSISGGFEGVVVLWDLKTQRRRFIPRLPPILALNGNNDGSYIVASCADNSVALIDPVTKTINTWHGLQVSRNRSKDMDIFLPPNQGCSSPVQPYPLGLTSGVPIAMTSIAGQIQIFDIYRNKHVQMINVTQGQHVAPSERERTNPMHIRSFVFNKFNNVHRCIAVCSKISSVMVDERSLLPELRILRFTGAQWVNEQTIYLLNYGVGASLLTFEKDGDLHIVVGFKGKVVIWKLIEGDEFEDTKFMTVQTFELAVESDVISLNLLSHNQMVCVCRTVPENYLCVLNLETGVIEKSLFLGQIRSVVVFNGDKIAIAETEDILVFDSALGQISEIIAYKPLLTCLDDKILYYSCKDSIYKVKEFTSVLVTRTIDGSRITRICANDNYIVGVSETGKLVFSPFDEENEVVLEEEKTENYSSKSVMKKAFKSLYSEEVAKSSVKVKYEPTKDFNNLLKAPAYAFPSFKALSKPYLKILQKTMGNVINNVSEDDNKGFDEKELIREKKETTSVTVDWTEEDVEYVCEHFSNLFLQH